MIKLKFVKLKIFTKIEYWKLKIEYDNNNLYFIFNVLYITEHIIKNEKLCLIVNN